MDTCKKIEEELSAYLDNELSSEQQQGVVEHLDVCSQCKEKMLLMQEAWKVLDQYQPEESSSNPASKFYTQTLPSYLLKARNLEEIRKFTKSKLLCYACVAAAGILFGIFFSQSSLYKSINMSDDILRNKEILNHPDFDIISRLELLENYEVFKHFTVEMLKEWKKKNQEADTKFQKNSISKQD